MTVERGGKEKASGKIIQSHSIKQNIFQKSNKNKVKNK